jgi:hypothetical protein
MKFSESCRQLAVLTLSYHGQVNCEVIRNLLQSCRSLRKLTINSSFHMQAYECLAIYGGNLTELKHEPDDVSFTRANLSFDLYDSSFKQQKKYPMKKLSWQTPALDVKNLAKFFACFGLIDELSIQLYPSMHPADFGAHDYDQIPIYHARKVSVISTLNAIQHERV